MTKLTNNRKSYKYEGMLLGCAMLWGMQFPMLKFVGETFDATSLLVIKFFLSTVVLLALGFKKIKLQGKKMLFHSIMLGILGAVQVYFQTVGLANTNPANSSFIITTNVIYVPIIMFLFFGKKPSRNMIIGLISITIGFLFISGIVNIYPFKVSLTLGYGDLLSLICAILTAVYLVYFNYLSTKYDEDSVNVIHLASSCLVMFAVWIVLAALGKTQMDFTNVPAMLGLVYCGVFAGGIATMLLARGTAHVEASKTAILCGLEPVFATLFAAILTVFIPSLDGTLTLSIVLGGALILYGAIKSSLLPEEASENSKQ